MRLKKGFEEAVLEEIFGAPALRQYPNERWLVSYSEYSKTFGDHSIKFVLLPASGEFEFSLFVADKEVLNMTSAHQTGSYAEIKDGKGFLILKDEESEYVTTIRLIPDLFIGQTLGPDT
ncbi:hypothetical protein [Hyphomonas sp. KY3]|jgi:hypothetical protein|uniref:hypothetical protein n=1 Tax=Hyphomonas sp. KY3 TaxID=2016196 RepID=UPI001A8C38E3|nr:hypothetical protein [Hyphomonas sp. KY3]QSR21412.1 hypothetical protein CFA77_03815 [Hyphomonas sp. KY3]